jgi:hypothetical protein
LLVASVVQGYLLVCDEGNGDGWHDLEVVRPQALEQCARTLLTHCAAQHKRQHTVNITQRISKITKGPSLVLSQQRDQKTSTSNTPDMGYSSTG